MKKNPRLLLAACLIAAFSCARNPQPGPAVEKTYLDDVLTDYAALAAAYPEAKDRFVEARFTLDQIISDVPAKDIKAKTLTTICYAWLNGHSEIYVCERDYSTGKTELSNYVADSPWLGDSQIPQADLKALKISLEQALDLAQKNAGEGDGIATANVTLRKPFFPFWPNPQYVFGGTAGRHDHVFVDAATGKVSIEEMPAQEGGSLAFLTDDYNTIMDLYKNQEKMGYSVSLFGELVEIRYELNKAMNEEQASELSPVKATYVFYHPAEDGHPAYLISCTRDSFKLGAGLSTFEEEPMEQPWTGGQYIGPVYLDDMVSLEDAIYAVKLGKVSDPDTNTVTLCFPTDYEVPVLKFDGEKTSAVYVDATTGELLF